MPDNRYTEEEQRKLREEFAPKAEQYRRIQLPYIAFSIWVLVLTSIVMSTMQVPADYADLAITIFSMVSWVIFQYAIKPGITCPGCLNNTLSWKLGEFCPRCGGGPIKQGEWPTDPTCQACGAKHGWPRRQRYATRACTHCGLFLDDTGI